MQIRFTVTGCAALLGVALLSGCQTNQPTQAQMDAAAYQSMQNIEVVRQAEEDLRKQRADAAAAEAKAREEAAAKAAAAKAKSERARANANAKAAAQRAERQKKIDAYNDRMKEIELELKELELAERRAATTRKTAEYDVKTERAKKELETLRNEVRALESAGSTQGL